MIIINLPLAIVFPAIICCHPFTQCVWLFILGSHISLNHSAHQVVPLWLLDVSYHPIHHQLGHTNFGAIWVQKWILGLHEEKSVTYVPVVHEDSKIII